MVGLVIIDLYGTIVKTDGRLPIRDGFEEFSQSYSEQGVKVVLFTDGPEESTIQILDRFLLWDKFDEVYTEKDLILVSYDDSFTGISYRLKNLQKPCNKFSVDPSNAVFIGDNKYGRDQRSADHYGIRFIRVPQYREDPPTMHERESLGDYVDFESRSNPFSFRSLIGNL